MTTPATPPHHLLSVLVENKAGVLARVASLFARRGYNIYSLAVAPTDDERFSRITVVVDVSVAADRERLVALAKKTGLDLRQSYTRVGKFALIRHQRYAHAKQFKRANKALRTLRTYLGRTIRDITRQIAGEDELQDIFRKDLHLASRVLEQRQNQRGKKVYSLHAPEVECIGKSLPSGLTRGERPTLLTSAA